MSKKITNSREKSWKTIQQKTFKRRVNTPQARWRFWKILFFRISIGTAFLLAFGVLMGLSYGLWSLGSSVSLAGPVHSLERVVVLSDGPLNQEWVLKRLNIKKGSVLSDVDIFAAKTLLESYPQVAGVIVQREFPDTLRVTIAEQRPIVRLNVRLTKGEVQNWLVSSTGVIYQGYGYNAQQLRALPYLEGVRLHKISKNQYKNLTGMDSVDELLSLVRERRPDLYRKIKTVEAHGLTIPDHPAPQIALHLDSNLIIVFKDGDFSVQLNRLGKIFAYIETHQLKQRVIKIDLTLEDQAAVQMDTPLSKSKKITSK
jgi:cell division septal protein FtsQ